MLVEEVDGFDAKSRERSLDGLSDAIGPAVDTSILTGLEINVEAEFGGDDNLFAERPQRFADDLFVGEGAIDFGRVEEGHAAVNRRTKSGRHPHPWIVSWRSSKYLIPPCSRDQWPRLEGRCGRVHAFMRCSFRLRVVLWGGGKHFQCDPQRRAWPLASPSKGEVARIISMISSRATPFSTAFPRLELVARLAHERERSG